MTPLKAWEKLILLTLRKRYAYDIGYGQGDYSVKLTYKTFRGKIYVLDEALTKAGGE